MTDSVTPAGEDAPDPDEFVEVEEWVEQAPSPCLGMADGACIRYVEGAEWCEDTCQENPS